MILELFVAVVTTVVFIAPFFIEQGDRAMLEKERRDCCDAFDQLFDGELAGEKSTEAGDRLGAYRIAHEVAQNPIDIGRVSGPAQLVKFKAMLVAVLVGDKLFAVAPPVEIFLSRRDSL